MVSKCRALLIDDGELDLVAAILTDLGVAYERISGEKLERPISHPSCLLVAPSRLAPILELERRRDPDDTERATWLAYVEGSSRTERTAMRQAGFDFTVPDQVHPAALRLLLARACFDGDPNNRRVSVGREMQFTLALRRRAAVLVDLSPTGARLLTRTQPRLDARVTLHLPTESGKRVHVTGRVVRVAPGITEGGSETETSLAVRFSSPTRERRERLTPILREYRLGPAVYQPGAHEAACAIARGGKAVHARGPRAAYTREVAVVSPTLGDAGVLVGRDLSDGGIRVDRHPELRVGRHVKLALHGNARAEPFVVTARVARDDGRRGVALRFVGLDPAARAKLRDLIQNLPPLQRHDDDTATHTAILAQVLSAVRKGR